MAKFNDWLKINHQFVDEGRPIKIGEYNAMLYWDKEKRHYRVEIKHMGNVGRSQLSAELAIQDAKATLGVK